MTAPVTGPAAAAPANARPRRRVLVVRVVFAVVLAVQTVLVLGQPVLAGSFLAGDYDALTQHGQQGNFIVPSGTALLVTAIVLWRFRGASGRLPLVVLGLLAAILFELHYGYTQTTFVHVPLGVAIVAVDLALVAWSVRTRFGSGASRTEEIR